jgi:pyruvate dehydrogenase E2 component (dihydrolipoamide acetyltransferase)
MNQTLVIPDIGDFKNVAVVEVLVKVGDTLTQDAPIATLETEKATMDVPASQPGTVVEVLIKAGDLVSAGTAVVVVAPSSDASQTAKTQITTPAHALNNPPTAGAQTAVDTVIRVPDIGDFKDVAVVEVLVKVGDQVQLEAPLATLETEKATMDVPATAAGVIKTVLIKAGDKVSAGAEVAVVTLLGQAAAASAAATVPATASGSNRPTVTPSKSSPIASAPLQARTAAPVAAPAAAPAVAPAEVAFVSAYASPSVRLLARELGVDLTRVSGSGPKNRITHDDVKAWVKQALKGGVSETTAATVTAGLPAVPEVDFEKFGPIEKVALSRIQKISGKRLHASWVNLPHVTQFDEADITELEVTRNKLKSLAQAAGIKLTPLAFIMRACAMVLQQYPRFAASLDASGDHLVLKKYLHIGFAADTPAGLVVPVMRDVDQKNLFQIAAELANLSDKARNGRLTAADMQGGCFTISSLGGIGGTAFTPIINAPEVAILGVSKSAMKPLYINGLFQPRLMLPLSLSYDHRVIDGAEAARFTTTLVQTLSQVQALVEGIQ